MRIHEIITESRRKDVDEGIGDVTLGQIGRGLGKAVGGLGKVAGGAVGATVGVGSALKQGYHAGRDWVAGRGSSGTTRRSSSGNSSGNTSTTQRSATSPSTSSVDTTSQVSTPAKPMTMAQLKKSIEMLPKKEQAAILKALEKKVGTIQ